jgi:hypothetical protein
MVDKKGLSNQQRRPPYSAGHMEMEGADMGGSDRIRTAIGKSIYIYIWVLGIPNN